MKVPYMQSETQKIKTLFETQHFSDSDDKLWEKALELIPRGVQTMSKAPNQFVDGVYPKFIDKASGAHVFDRNGIEYIDYACALGPIILGYNNETVNKAIENQLKKGITFSLPSTLELELAKLVHEVVPCAEQVRFAKNGSDATLAAVRIARSFTEKEHIAKCGYHGWGDWHAITLREYGVPKVLKNYVHEFEYNNLDSLEKLLKRGDIAGIIMEAQALTKPAVGFLEGVRELATKYKAVLIFDEVVTGFRWALGGAQQYYNVIPDLACIGKAMGNGMPISAVCGKKEYMQELNHIFFSMTFGGECLSLAAAIETIKILKRKDYSHIWKLGTLLEDGIKWAAQKHNPRVNFAGSAPRHNLSFPALDKGGYVDASGMNDLFKQEMVKQNILWSNVIYIQFAHTHEDIAKTIVAANEAFKFVSEHTLDVDKVLEGKRSEAIFRKNT